MKETIGMQYWNGNQVCAIDCETTGLDPQWHEICQIAIVPLMHDFSMRKSEGIYPLVLKLKPNHPETVDPKAMTVNKQDLHDLLENGIDQEVAKVILREWTDKLGLPFTPSGVRKRIIPLGHNYDFDKSFIQAWLGQAEYDELFDYEIRDTKRVVAYINDRASMRGEDIPFPHTKLTRVAFRLGVDATNAHDALQDCLITANVYRRLMDWTMGMFS